MDELLHELDLLIARLPGQAFFRPAARDEDIAAAETAMGVALPESYKLFLRAHDGGFIAEDRVDEADESEVSAQRWNSNHLRGCAELVREYKDLVLLARDVERGLVDWPYVPFCQTSGQEVLVFGPPGSDGIEPVLDAFHEVGPAEWDVLSASFDDFLRVYIDNAGFPSTVALTKR